MQFKWVVEFEIDEVWVADGFEMTDERANAMIQSEIGYAYDYEAKAKVLKAPPQSAIRKVQRDVDE